MKESDQLVSQGQTLLRAYQKSYDFFFENVHSIKIILKNVTRRLSFVFSGTLHNLIIFFTNQLYSDLNVIIKKIIWLTQNVFK